MSQNKEFVNEIIKDIDSLIREGLDEADFIKDFRKRIEKYLSERLK